MKISKSRLKAQALCLPSGINSSPAGRPETLAVHPGRHPRNVIILEVREAATASQVLLLLTAYTSVGLQLHPVRMSSRERVRM